VSSGTQGLDLSADKGEASLSLLSKSGNDSNQVTLAATQDVAYVHVEDKSKFRTNIGTQDLIAPSTGEKHRTSAAAIKMFNDKGSLIWSAP
jgi:hypothetical protein